MPRRVRAGKPTGTDNQVTARHDAAFAHFLVEEYFGIELGVWGQLAAGGGGIFFPVPQNNSLRYRRRAQRIGHVGRVDMQRSERLVAISVAAWEEGIGRVKHVPSPGQDDLDRGDLEGVVRRLSEVADRWGALPPGGFVTLEWPRGVAFPGSRSHRGRRATRPTPHRARH